MIKKLLKGIIILIISLGNVHSYAQKLTARDAAVEVSSLFRLSPGRITLKWPQVNNASGGYLIYRKAKTDTKWGTVVDKLPADAIYYIDTKNISSGHFYEYKIEKSGFDSIGRAFKGYGYICAGIDIPFVEKRGKLILIVDSTYMDYLAEELKQLEEDIVGDGWEVIRYNVSRSDSVPYIKNLIKKEYHLDSLNVKAVFLFGHVPVPYSGSFGPDAHGDHQGAWPADCYYGDMDGVWTDSIVNNTSSAYALNKNIPRDGKFDQSTIPSNIELQVGRVDLSNLPSFKLSEKDLLKQYLIKDHSFKHKYITAKRRGLIDSNFGYLSGEAFGSNGWKNFAPMFSSSEIDELDYFTTLKDESYLWAQGDGGGTFGSAGGIGSTVDFDNVNVKSVFNIIYGSYFGDWNTTDNFLRAPLASAGYCLTNVWAGRPHCYFHHMALGENIGYSIRLSQNNTDELYFAISNYQRDVHIALMGDPTLRLHIVNPVSDLKSTRVDTTIELTWKNSPDAILGYNVYRASDKFGSFSRLNNLPINDNTFIDEQPLKENNVYMVRSIKLDSSASGSYYNLSQGVFNEINFDQATGINGVAQEELEIFPNPSSGNFNLRINSSYIGKLEIEVKNSLGQTINQFDVAKEKGYIEYYLSLQAQPAGLYLLRINSGKMSCVKSLIKY